MVQTKRTILFSHYEAVLRTTAPGVCLGGGREACCEGGPPEEGAGRRVAREGRPRRGQGGALRGRVTRGGGREAWCEGGQHEEVVAPQKCTLLLLPGTGALVA